MCLKKVLRCRVRTPRPSADTSLADRETRKEAKIVAREEIYQVKTTAISPYFTSFCVSSSGRFGAILTADLGLPPF